MQRIDFTPPQIAEILDLNSQKMPIPKIAEIFDVDYSLISRELKKQGVQPTQAKIKIEFSEEEKQTIKELYVEDKQTIKQISIILGKGINPIRKLLQEMGVKLRSSKIDFTQEQKDLVRDLHSQGKHHKEIAKIIGCGIGSIKSLYEEMELPLPKRNFISFTDNEKNQIVELYRQYTTIASIAKAFNKDKRHIKKLLVDLGIYENRGKYDFTSEQIDMIKSLNASGMSQRKVAKEMNVSKMAMRRVYTEHNIPNILVNKIPPNEEGDVIQLYNGGMEIKDIAAEYNVEYHNVLRLLKVNGIDTSTSLTDEDKAKIVALRKSGMMITKIADEVDFCTGVVRDYLHSIGDTDTRHRLEPNEKTCIICNETKPIEDFPTYQTKDRGGGSRTVSRTKCIPCFELRDYLSHNIRQALLQYNENGKDNRSCMEFLPYTILELRIHIESQFEEWMNWNNWGMYDKREWDDNDPTTWKWNIDHIRPQISFKFREMIDPDFQECWGLANLRPLSAKQNLIDNDRGFRAGTYQANNEPEDDDDNEDQDIEAA